MGVQWQSGWLWLPQGLAEPPGMGRSDIPGLQLALAVGATTYLLRDRKRLSLRAPLASRHVLRMRIS